jgi:MOSC domain-containing protein YiiM
VSANANIIELIGTRLGQPAILGRDHRGAKVWSSIHRLHVVVPRLYLTPTGLAGDQPTDTRLKTNGNGQMHGGPDKAVYAYPCTHYPHWLEELGREGLGTRSFGENWRIRGADETTVHIGDIWTIGEAELEVSRVRTPCKTLETYFGGGQQMIKRMCANGRCGWYLKVRRPGVVPTRGSIRVTHRNLGSPTIAEAFAAKMKTQVNA